MTFAAAPDHDVIDAEIVGATILNPKIVDGKIVDGRIVGGRVVHTRHRSLRAALRARHLATHKLQTELVAVLCLGLLVVLLYLI